MVSRRESRGPRVRRERWGRRRSREKRYVITHRVPHPAPLQISKHNGGFDVSPGRKRTVATLCSQRLSLHGGETRRELWRRERWQEWIKSFFVGRYNSDSCCLCCYRMNLDRSPFPLPPPHSWPWPRANTISLAAGASLGSRLCLPPIFSLLSFL